MPEFDFLKCPRCHCFSRAGDVRSVSVGDAWCPQCGSNHVGHVTAEHQYICNTDRCHHQMIRGRDKITAAQNMAEKNRAVPPVAISVKKIELDLPPILRRKHLLKLLPFGSTKLWRLQCAGQFPKSRIIAGIQAWNRDEILSWLGATLPPSPPNA